MPQRNLQADHTPLDILLVRPDGQTAKPWLTNVIDDYSRAVAGYFLSFEDPSVLHTSLALRQAIWRKEEPRWIVCGIPDVLYTGNGSDFTSQHLEQVGADLKIRLVFSIPGKPRGRGRIERFFATVNEMFLCQLDGYAPSGRGVRGKASLTLAGLDAKLKAFLLNVYHRRDNAETKTPPIERWEANGFLPRMPDSLEQLDLLLIQGRRIGEFTLNLNSQPCSVITAGNLSQPMLARRAYSSRIAPEVMSLSISIPVPSGAS